MMFLKKLNVLECLGDVQAAISISRQGLGYARKVRDDNLRATFLRNLGVAHWGLGEHKEALNLFNELLNIAEDSESESLRLVATGNIGLVQFWMGKKRIAMEYFLRALGIAKRLKDERNISIAYELIGQTHREMGNHREALRYLKKALKIAIKQGNRRGEGILYGGLGDLYYDMRDHERAYSYFKRAQKVASDIQDRWSECIWLSNMGTLLMFLGKEKKGIPFLERSLEITRQLKLYRSEKVALRGLVRAHIDLGDFDTAEELATHGMDLSRRMNDRQHMAWFLTLLGIIAIKRGNAAAALQDLGNATNLADPKEDAWQHFRAKVFLKRAEFLKRRSKDVLSDMRSFVDSLQMSDTGTGEVDSLREEEVIAEAYLVLSTCLKEMGKRKEAAEYNKKAQELIEEHKLYSLKQHIKGMS
jgi:tetratricopeptide (TPR) repeat protein